MELLCGFIGAVVASVVVSIYFYARSATGTLRIDHSNPEKEVYRIEISNLDTLSKKKRVVLRVDNDADLSQK